MHESDLHDAYHHLSEHLGDPPDLIEWGQRIEHAADIAYRGFQVKDTGCQWKRDCRHAQKIQGKM